MPFRRTRSLSFFAFTLALAGLTACGDDESSDHDADGHVHGGPTGCGLEANCADFDLQQLAEGLTVAGDDGVLSVEIVEHTDLSVRDNTWTVKVTDADGAVVDAEVRYGVWSLDCMHPGPTPEETVTTDADGVAEIAPVNAHGGPWEAELTIQAGDRSDVVRIGLCVPGDAHGEDAGSE